MVRGQGQLVWDVDGNRYIDHLGAFGPLELGHANPAIVEAIRTAVGAGGSFGATTVRAAHDDAVIDATLNAAAS